MKYSGGFGSVALVRSVVVVATLVGAVLMTGCTSIYVDTATREVPVSEMKKVSAPQPVQLAFEFQSNGAANPRVTAILAETVTEEVKATGFFSSVSAEPLANTGLLRVTLNNLPGENAASKGFVTGLTFGIAGSVVTDYYVCTVSYLPPGQSTPIVKVARHALHTTVGNANPPSNAVKSPSVQDAVVKITRDALSNALNDLSRDPGFN